MEKSDKEISGQQVESAQSAPPQEIKAAEYIKAARAHLKGGRQKAAYILLMEAVVHYPDDAIILSLYGSLQALVDKKCRSGVDSCRKALTLFKPKDSRTASVLYPLFYLNLGRAYLAAGKKKEAVEAFLKGLDYDKHYSELKKEMKLLGMRKKPPVAFLERSNPINIFIGMLVNKTG